MPHMTVADQDICYVDEGAGEAVLLLPDNLHSSSAYESEIDYFSQRFRVISYDYPGVGKSTRDVLYEDERIQDLWEFRSDFAMHMLLDLGIRSAYVMGFSCGALSALHFAGYHAKLHDFTVKGLVCDSFLSRMDQRTMHHLAAIHRGRGRI